MIKVLDLFSGTRSVLKMLMKKYKTSHTFRYITTNGLVIHVGHQRDKKLFEYVGIDIYSDDGDNTVFDLSQENIRFAIVKLLGLWEPTFIWASPLCTPFSRATSIKGGTLPYKITNEVLAIRKAEEFKEITHKGYIKHVNDPVFIKKHQEKGAFGLKLFENTKIIARMYNIPFAIENPAMAVSKYIMKEYIKNDTAYCAYGFDYKKATAIYTNQKLDLLKCTHKKHAKVMSGNPTKTGITPTASGNAERSKVPPLLIKSIIEQLTGKDE